MEKEFANYLLILFNTKWTKDILYLLYKNNLRFNELEKTLKPISKKILSNRLKKLEQLKLIKKDIFSITPIKIEYSITNYGKKITPIYIEIEKWEQLYSNQQDIYLNTHLPINQIGKKWKFQLIYILSNKSKRFGEIKKELTPISQKMLTQQLRELEKDHIIQRKIYKEKTLKVEYSLTKIGLNLLPIVNNIHQLKKDCE